MNTVIYCNYGMPGRAAAHVYTERPDGSARYSEPVMIYIPDIFGPRGTPAGIELTDLPNCDRAFLLSDLLACAPDGLPRLEWLDKDGARWPMRLTILTDWSTPSAAAAAVDKWVKPIL